VLHSQDADRHAPAWPAVSALLTGFGRNSELHFNSPQSVTAVTGPCSFGVDLRVIQTYIQAQGDVMKDIHEVLRRKQAQYTQLGKQIEMLQQAAEKLREVAPLLAENENEDDSAVLAEVDEENGGAMAAKAGAQASSAAKPSRSATPRWP
jgi:TolA-binding protein